MSKIYTEDEIKEIYKRVKPKEEYFKKYEKLPPCPIQRQWNKNFDYPRARCILDFRDWIEKHQIKPKHLGATYNDFELRFIHPEKTTMLPFPPHDLHKLTETCKEKFDFFLFSQTLEHLYNPHLAVQQICSVVETGGYIFTSVPTINIPHSTPIHFSGIYPIGLALMFMSNDCEVVEMGQWGNFDYIRKMFRTHGWPSYDDLKDKEGKVPNEEKNVCQCWILVQKK